MKTFSGPSSRGRRSKENSPAALTLGEEAPPPGRSSCRPEEEMNKTSRCDLQTITLVHFDLISKKSAAVVTLMSGQVTFV